MYSFIKTRIIMIMCQVSRLEEAQKKKERPEKNPNITKPLPYFKFGGGGDFLRPRRNRILKKKKKTQEK